MKYLVDANVLSETTKAEPAEKPLRWLLDHEKDLAVDAVVLGELQLGVSSLPEGHRRRRVEDWFDEVVKTLVCLPWDSAVARRWGRLVSDLRRRGRSLPILDTMIAATALEHGLIVATRNVRDFKPTGARVLNPFE